MTLGALSVPFEDGSVSNIVRLVTLPPAGDQVTTRVDMVEDA